MFTGIVTDVGSVRGVKRAAREAEFDIACRFESIALGESIAVNGVCLTVTSTPSGGFTVVAAAETLARTTAGTLGVGDRVNLERALAVGDRLGGHLVSGHVDGVGCIRSIELVGEAVKWSIEAPRECMRFIAKKGSVTIDGVSLTVNEASPTHFEVMLIPFTLRATTLGDRRVGSSVNLEVDLVARYVARLLESATDAANPSGGINEELLARAGFIRS